MHASVHMLKTRKSKASSLSAVTGTKQWKKNLHYLSCKNTPKTRSWWWKWASFSVQFQVAGIVRAAWLSHCHCHTLNRTEASLMLLITPSIFLLWDVKLSAVKKKGFLFEMNFWLVDDVTVGSVIYLVNLLRLPFLLIVIMVNFVQMAAV